MKKTLFVFLVLIVFIAGYYHFNKPQMIQFKGCDDLHLAKISEEASELRGSLVFYNPNKMRAQLGKVAFHVVLNGDTIGVIHEDFATAIKGDEEFHFSFQLRFPMDEVLGMDTTIRDLPVTVTGIAGSDVVFSNYTFPIHYSGTIKNVYQ